MLEIRNTRIRSLAQSLLVTFAFFVSSTDAKIGGSTSVVIDYEDVAPGKEYSLRVGSYRLYAAADSNAPTDYLNKIVVSDGNKQIDTLYNIVKGKTDAATGIVTPLAVAAPVIRSTNTVHDYPFYIHLVKADAAALPVYFATSAKLNIKEANGAVTVLTGNQCLTLRNFDANTNSKVYPCGGECNSIFDVDTKRGAKSAMKLLSPIATIVTDGNTALSLTADAVEGLTGSYEPGGQLVITAPGYSAAKQGIRQYYAHPLRMKSFEASFKNEASLALSDFFIGWEEMPPTTGADVTGFIITGQKKSVNIPGIPLTLLGAGDTSGVVSIGGGLRWTPTAQGVATARLDTAPYNGAGATAVISSIALLLSTVLPRLF